MEETYCIVDKRKTPCVEPSGYQRDKRGRLQFSCTFAFCGNKKVRYSKKTKSLEKEKKNKKQEKVKKLNSPSEGAGVFDAVVDTAADAFVHHGITWMAKKKVFKWEDMAQANSFEKYKIYKRKL